MTITCLCGDCREVLETLPDESVHCVVTSPPYFGLRDYGIAGQIGLEPTPDEYVAQMVAVFHEVRRVLRKDGTLWLNLGDSYAGGGNGGGGSFAKDGIRCAEPGTDKNKAFRVGKRGAIGLLKPKDLIGIPWRVAFALQADGWWLRQDIIWSKPNPMPESVTDRCTKAHEYIFLLSKSAKYYYDADAIAEQSIYAGNQVSLGEKSLSVGQANGANGANVAKSGNALVDSVIVKETRNKRSVWEVATQPFSEAHFATFPPALIEPCILAGCPKGGTVLDPFGGAGTTGLAADRLERNAILIELNEAYADMARTRIEQDAPLFVEFA
jgi:DNA modification methylase